MLLPPVTPPASALRLSVVIATWRDAPRIERAVYAACRLADEVVVVDAASDDETPALAAAEGAHVLQAPRGRARQLHAGACVATGDVLLFLRPETILPVRARAAILRALATPAVVGGNFRLAFHGESLPTRLAALARNLGRRWAGVYYGDSAIFMRRQVYEALGGFRAMPVLEDYDLARRLEAYGRTAFIEDVVVRASARSFAEQPLRALLGLGVLHGLYGLGGLAEGRLVRAAGAAVP